MPRFAILTHDYPTLHWDLLLEWEGTLRTFRLPAPPDGSSKCAALLLPDHRLLYLDYEGPVSGNRGEVIGWDRGELEWLEQEPGRMAVRARGARLHGILRLRANADRAEWEFTYAEEPRSN